MLQYTAATVPGAKSSFHMPLDSQLTVKLAIVAYLYTVQIFGGIFDRGKFPMAYADTDKFWVAYTEFTPQIT